MASISTLRSQATENIATALQPFRARWNALDAGPRRLLLIGASLLVAGFAFAFVWLPATRTREALATRLPQLETRLATMRNQAQQIKALANEPVVPATMRSAADVAALQSIFGPDAQVTVVADGFRVVITAINYAGWWDKTRDALSRHALSLRTATLTRVGGSGSTVAVDMRLGTEPRVPGAIPTQQAK